MWYLEPFYPSALMECRDPLPDYRVSVGVGPGGWTVRGFAFWLVASPEVGCCLIGWLSLSWCKEGLSLVVHPITISCFSQGTFLTFLTLCITCFDMFTLLLGDSNLSSLDLGCFRMGGSTTHFYPFLGDGRKILRRRKILICIFVHIFIKGHLDLVMSQHLDMRRNQNISPLFPKYGPLACCGTGSPIRYSVSICLLHLAVISRE